MPRPLPQILAHIRAVAGNPSISTTLIQTEDLLALCDEVDAAERLRVALKRIDGINDNPARYNPEIDAVIRGAFEQNGYGNENR